MQEKFEHNIAQQVGDFKLQPSPTVWYEVDAALHPERKRRIIIWWLFGAALIIFGVICYWKTLYQYNKTPTQLSQNNTITQPKDVSKQQQLQKQNNIISSTLMSATVTINQSSITHFNIDKELVIKVAKQQKNSIGIVLLRTDIIANKKHTPLLNATNDITKASDNNKKKGVDNRSATTEFSPIVKTESDNPTDSTIIKVTNQNNNKTAVTATLKDTKKANIKKAAHWLLMAGAGTLQTTLGPNFNKAVYSSSASVGSGGVTSGINNPTSPGIPKITDPKTGYNLQLGIAYSTFVSKSWSLQTGLQYQYLANKHGLKPDTTTGFTNSFIADDNHFITNKSHILQVPITFTYSLGTKPKQHFSLLIGPSFAYILSEKWLISNTNTGRFYYNASANNRWLLGLHGGISYSFNQKLSIAALAEYTLTPIQHDVTDKYHFVQYNLQIATPIYFKHKSFTKK